MNAEEKRLTIAKWRKWGPYVSNRQWGTVREDYSANGDAWNYTTHDTAEAKTWRWGEEGIGGICDEKQLLCFAFGFWNRKDRMIKERFFGLTNGQGNHGEDVKEYYYYLDSSPTHSYMKMLYKYPHQAFPYDDLIQTNARRKKDEAEYELVDTGIFNQDAYFDIFIEYAKADVADILIKLSVVNRSSEHEAPITILPAVWFRNTWAWGYDAYKPQLSSASEGIRIEHQNLNISRLYSDAGGEQLFTENETNNRRLYGWNDGSRYAKDGINQYIMTGNEDTINPKKAGTKAGFKIEATIKPGETKVFRFRLSAEKEAPFSDFDQVFNERQQETDSFYQEIQKGIDDPEKRMIQRQAFAGLLWSKQFYYYDVARWLDGDPAQIKPPESRHHIRNTHWRTLNNAEIISMPDKWEYPWYATWDLAFHCITFAIIDTAFAKDQLLLFTRVWYMHPNGQLPAYEWNFDDVNPPVHAWAAFRVFKIDEKKNGKPDVKFLASVFQKLLLCFTWWVNRKDKMGNNIFGGGFLGLDNIGAYNRDMVFQNEDYLEQTDGTSWMAMFSLNMLRIALELALYDPVYEDMATKFFEHFLYIANALNNLGEDHQGLWDEADGFYYDVLRFKDGHDVRLKLKSIVGMIPMFAVEVFPHEFLRRLPRFEERLQWLLKNKPELVSLVSNFEYENKDGKHMMSMLKPDRLKRMLATMLNPNQFLSDHGIRALSKEYEKDPFRFKMNDSEYVVKYLPAESDSNMFGGNSNWRGPVWMPLNLLIIESLQRFHFYLGDDFRVEYPAYSGNFHTLDEIAEDLSGRLCGIFLKDLNGNRPVNGSIQKFQKDPNFRDYILFYEYFHGDNGSGIGASHQTGWTSVIAKLIQPRMG